MRAGDIVRFYTHNTRGTTIEGCEPDWKLGLLVEYHKWEKVARILYEGKVVSVRAEKTQLAVRGNEEI